MFYIHFIPKYSHRDFTMESFAFNFEEIYAKRVVQYSIWFQSVILARPLDHWQWLSISVTDPFHGIRLWLGYFADD